MKNIIVGTAGHIDHGKTALIKALTGMDADRLPEEKRRGITIDLGFAHLQLTPVIRIGFIDVPGHERFVRNMLAGAAGIDVVLLVVAANESIKPQTREHFAICRLLGVNAGVISITKTDLVNRDALEMVRLEIAELVADSFLENAPVLAVSSTNGEGLAELRTALAATALQAKGKSDTGLFRLPIDRAFTIKGFGTVVTGTLISGTLKRNQEVELYPTGRRLRPRGLQVYGEAADEARAGQRTAVNLPDIEPSQIKRGMVLAEPGSFTPVTSFACRLEMLPAAAPLKRGAPVHLHIGSASMEARIRGGQVALRHPLPILPGDRFIIRSFSPVATIGGGVVLEPPILRVTPVPARPPAVQPEAQAITALERSFEAAGLTPPDVSDLVQTPESRAAFQALLKQGVLTRVSADLALHRTALAPILRQLALRRGESFHVADFKAWTGMSRKYAIPLLEYLDRNHITKRESGVRLIL